MEPSSDPRTNIERIGRIIAVADVFDTLTSRRSHKKAWDDREAYDEIVRCWVPSLTRKWSRRSRNATRTSTQFV